MTPTERNEIVERHVGLVHYFARSFRASGMGHEDLVQEGRVGLIDAADRFDPRRGTKFSTYAMWHIRKAIMDAIRDRNDMIRTPRRRQGVACGSIDKLDLADVIGDDARPVADVMVGDEERDAVRACIRQLPHRDAIVIRLRHGIDTDPLTLRKVGAILDVSPERVRQIQAQAEEKLRQLVVECATLKHHGAVPAGRQNESAEPATE